MIPSGQQGGKGGAMSWRRLEVIMGIVYISCIPLLL